MEESGVPQSPCSKQCIINPKTSYCMGCYRTINEITKWINLTDDEKKEIMKKIEKRKRDIIKNRESSYAVWLS